MKMLHSSSLADALEKAREICSSSGISDPDVVVIPDGVGVVVYK